ncbi:hypothetical protein [Luteimicrobium subarcticum]|uniref:Uncharacterized protein n=1 Tax=Luteimicrobium subarcticum TaxID=620910 RepID=A0A2M8W1R6_9MICO|nr:hypothetical protein [Luteimicrobium subarcticum]PJI84864.1 hypothetical protein CLV34_3109 [Luteimicrobium subarcticum]
MPEGLRVVRPPRAIAVARAWRLPLVAAGLAVYGLLAALLAGPVTIPGRTVKDVVAPLLPLLVVGAYTAAQHVLVTATVERRHPRYRWRRLLLVALTLAGGALVAALVGLCSDVSPLVLDRNLALFLGVVLLAGPAATDGALVVLTLFGAGSWILGSHGAGVPPASWALPLALPDAPAAAAAGCAALVGGLVRVAFSRP